MATSKSPLAAADGHPTKQRAALAGPRRALPTKRAAEYMGVSASLLRKYRLRGPDDPGAAGPDFIKISPTLVVYEIEELDRWLESHRSAPKAVGVFANGAATAMVVATPGTESGKGIPAAPLDPRMNRGSP